MRAARIVSIACTSTASAPGSEKRSSAPRRDRASPSSSARTTWGDGQVRRGRGAVVHARAGRDRDGAGHRRAGAGVPRHPRHHARGRGALHRHRELLGAQITANIEEETGRRGRPTTRRGAEASRRGSEPPAPRVPIGLHESRETCASVHRRRRQPKVIQRIMGYATIR